MHSNVLCPPLHDFKKTVTVESGIWSSKLYTNSHFHCPIPERIGGVLSVISAAQATQQMVQKFPAEGV